MNYRRLGSILVMMFAWSVRGGETPSWEVVWADEFEQRDGAAPNSQNWVHDLGGHGWGNLELQTYTSRRENSRIEQGQLVIEARRETLEGTDGISRDYSSARLKTLGRASWTYGRMEARMRLTEGRGLWPAFWMLGVDLATIGWPECGEIDIMENIGHEPTTVYGTVHGPGYSAGDNIGSEYELADGTRWSEGHHLYAVEWEPERLRWLVDNRVYFEVTPASLPEGAPWVFDHPFFLLLNVAVGGRFPGAPDADTEFPQRLWVDYVRVYRGASSALPVVRVVSYGGGGEVEVVWPRGFPQARLQRVDRLGERWRDQATDGAYRGDDFVAVVTPGLYRLVWEP